MIQIEKYERKGDTVDLIYSDGEVVVVKYEDFNRAFGAILGASKKKQYGCEAPVLFFTVFIDMKAAGLNS